MNKYTVRFQLTAPDRIIMADDAVYPEEDWGHVVFTIGEPRNPTVVATVRHELIAFVMVTSDEDPTP